MTIMNSFPSLTFLLVSSLLLTGSRGVIVELYTEPNFRGTINEIQSSANCTDLPVGLQNFKGSIKNNGCIAVFKGSKCLWGGFVVREEESQINELESKYLHDKRQNYNVNSIRDCNELENGPEVNLDVSWSRFYTDDPGEEENYRNNTCNCIQLPDSSLYDVSVNLHGNCFQVYENEYCAGEPFTKVHGIHGDFPNSGRSVMRCDRPTHCTHRLYASVFAIDPNYDTSNLLGSIRDKETSLRIMFTNNGSGAIERVYRVNESLWETASFQFSDALNQIISICLKGEAEKVLRFSIPFVSHASETLRTDLGKDSKLRYHTLIGKQFRIHKNLVVPQCTKYEVSSVIEMVENIEINYKVMLTISGTYGITRDLTRYEIKKAFEKFDETQIKFLDGHEQANDFRVVAETTAKLRLDYGRNAVVSATGVPLLDCYVRHKQCSFECKG